MYALFFFSLFLFRLFVYACACVRACMCVSNLLLLLLVMFFFHVYLYCFRLFFFFFCYIRVRLTVSSSLSLSLSVCVSSPSMCAWCYTIMYMCTYVFVRCSRPSCFRTMISFHLPKRSSASNPSWISITAWMCLMTATLWGISSRWICGLCWRRRENSHFTELFF